MSYINVTTKKEIDSKSYTELLEEFILSDGTNPLLEGETLQYWKSRIIELRPTAKVPWWKKIDARMVIRYLIYIIMSPVFLCGIFIFTIIWAFDNDDGLGWWEFVKKVWREQEI